MNNSDVEMVLLMQKKALHIDEESCDSLMLFSDGRRKAKFGLNCWKIAESFYLS